MIGLKVLAYILFYTNLQSKNINISYYKMQLDIIKIYIIPTTFIIFIFVFLFYYNFALILFALNN